MLNQFTASLWGDEAFSAVLSSKPIPEIISIITRDTSPPLYNITERIAFEMFGNSEVVIRGLSFFYYCLAIFFVYKIGAYLWNKKTGLLAAILAFLNPFFFIYAFEGRMYSIMALGVAASMYFFLRKKPIFYAVATAWALYSHHFAIFAVMIQGVWFMKEFLFGKREGAVVMFKGFAIAGVLYLPWLPFLYKQTKMVQGGFWLGTPTLIDLRNLVYEYLGQGISHKLAVPSLYLTLIILLLRRTHKDMNKSLFVSLWFLGPIILAWGISQKFTSIFYNRYLLYAIPAAMLAVASKPRKISYVLILVLIGTWSIIDYSYFTHPTKRPYRDLAQYVAENKKGDDYLINWNSSSHHLWESKYYKIPAPIYNSSGNELPFFVGTALMTKEDIVDSIPKNTNRVIAITSGPTEEVQLQGFAQLENKTFNDLKVVWLKKK